jgi:hypothetical protein
MKMIILVALFVLTCSANLSGAIQSQPVEFFRIQKVQTGYLIAMREIPSRGTHWLEFRFRLDGFDAKNSAHLAIGLGDLYRYFDSGLVPVADGFVVGESGECLDKGIAVNFESYGAEIPGKTLDCPTAFGPLDRNLTYRVMLSVSQSGVVHYALFDEAGLLLSEATRSWNGRHGAHARGLFVIPYSPGQNGAYELISMRAGYQTY